MRNLRPLAALVPILLGLAGEPAPARPPRIPRALHTFPDPPAGPVPAPPAEPVAAPAPVPDPAGEPVPATAPPPAAPAAPEPLYSLDVVRQDAQDVILEFARRARQSVIMLDPYYSLISVSFRNLPFEKALRRLCRAAELDFVKDDEGYTVGLPIDLKLNFPNPDAGPDEEIDATYRCRRIDALTLQKTISLLLGEEKIKASVGPAFLTPPVDKGESSRDDSAQIRALAATEANFRTHDVGFSGKAQYVRRALALARKFDRPRKQVRVKVRIMQMASSLTRELGVNWMDSLPLVATEVANAGSTTATPDGSSDLKQVKGIRLGRFTHTPLSLNATLNAAETAGKTKTLSNPTLLVLDGEKGFILSGTKYTYPKISQTYTTGQTSYDTTEQREGIYLQVGVQVGVDNDMTLTLYPQVTNVTDFQNINGVKYPVIATVEEQATVRALSGEVIVLGGLRQTQMVDNQAMVPFLGHIPILGKLFSSDTKKRNDQELVFFLTPELVEDPDPPVQMKMETRPAS